MENDAGNTQGRNESFDLSENNAGETQGGNDVLYLMMILSVAILGATIQFFHGAYFWLPLSIFYFCALLLITPTGLPTRDKYYTLQGALDPRGYHHCVYCEASGIKWRVKDMQGINVCECDSCGRPLFRQ